MRRISLALALVPLLCGFTCGHVQEEGRYAFVADQILTDTCQLLAPGADAGHGTLRVLGNDVRIDDFAVQGAAMQLVGAYQWNVEDFYLDGSGANVSATVGGQACLWDLVSVSLTAITDDPTHFHGSMRINDQAQTRPACQCQATLTFHAKQ